MSQNKLYYDLHKDIFTGVSYSGGEPLLYLDRILDLASYINEQSEGKVYQWMYTNGTLLTKEILKKLKEVGIKEVRVDLASSNYHPSIIKKLNWIKEYMERTTVEVPSIPETFEALVSNKLIGNLTIDQLNLAETILQQPINWSTYAIDIPLVKYRGNDGYHPSNSWEITYQIFEAAKDAGVLYNINDCSQQTKYLQMYSKKVQSSV
jgi:pyruvate formate-lyase activating enzyme-like uncharacterized protein